MVVVNLHLYGLDLAAGGVILPEHDVVIIDEAHQLEDIVSATSGVELTAGRFIDLARRTRGVVADDRLAAGVDDAGRILTEALRPHRDKRLQGRAPRTTSVGRSRWPGSVRAGAGRRPGRVRRARRRTPEPGPCDSSSRPPR